MASEEGKSTFFRCEATGRLLGPSGASTAVRLQSALAGLGELLFRDTRKQDGGGLAESEGSKMGNGDTRHKYGIVKGYI